MAVALSFAPTTTGRSSGLRHATSRPISRVKMDRLRCNCNGENSASNSPSVYRKPEPESENAVLKAAWYSSELLGIAASFFRQPAVNEPAQIDLPRDGAGVVDRSLVAETIRQDYARSYFVTGNLAINAYEEDCEFADPAGSFKGLRRFKRNCTNFGSLLEKSNMKLMRWEDSEPLDTQNTFSMQNREKYAVKACGALECSQDGVTEADLEAKSMVLVEKFRQLKNSLAIASTLRKEEV